jgi:flagellar biosynthesis protein
MESMPVGKKLAALSKFSTGVAVRYDERLGDAAPQVLIKASASETEWLVRTARELGVPVVEDSATAKALSELPLDTEIPEELYRAVAVVINQLEQFNGQAQAPR